MSCCGFNVICVGMYFNHVPNNNGHGQNFPHISHYVVEIGQLDNT